MQSGEFVDNKIQPLTLKKVAVDMKIDPALLKRIYTLTLAADNMRTEISGIGEAEVSKVDGVDVVNVLEPLHILKQSGNMVGTHLDMDALADILDGYVRQGKSPKRLRFWYHTHPGSVYWSMTDEATIEKLSSKYMDTLVAGVFNDKGESHWAIARGGEILLEFDYKIRLARPTHDEIAKAEEFLEDKVERRKWYQSWTHGGMGFRGGHHGGGSYGSYHGFDYGE